MVFATRGDCFAFVYRIGPAPEPLDYTNCRSFVKSIVDSKLFEAIFALLICVSAVVMALEAEYNGIGIAYDLGYPWSDQPEEKVWPWATTTFNVLGT